MSPLRTVATARAALEYALYERIAGVDAAADRLVLAFGSSLATGCVRISGRQRYLMDGDQLFVFFEDPLNRYLVRYFRRRNVGGRKPGGRTSRKWFTPGDSARIRELLATKCAAPSHKKKRYRDKLRRMGFYITDWRVSGKEFGPEDFDSLLPT